MKNLIKNQTFLTLTSADIFETIGTSLFNIILLTYAKNFAHANLMVSIVSVATVMPGVLGVFIGQIGDRTHNKRIWLAGTKFIQGILYLTLAQLINRHQVTLLMIIILINIISDLLGMYSGSLRMPIIQAKIAEAQQEEAVGINSGISTVMQMLGQAFGVSLLAITHDYQLAGYVNAATFFIAGVILIAGYQSLEVHQTHQKAPAFKKMLVEMKKTLEASASTNAWALLSSILFLNAVGSSQDAIINLYLVDQGDKLPLPFGVSVLIINSVVVIGSILGSILHSGIFKQWSFKSVMTVCVISMELFYLNLLGLQSFWGIIVTMGIGGFCMGQANPKLTAALLKVANPDIIGSLTGLMNTVCIISMPIGTIGIVLLYNVVNPAVSYLISMVLLFISIACLYLPNKKRQVATTHPVS